MVKTTLAVAMASLLSVSCSMENRSEVVSNLPNDYFYAKSRCIKEWSSLFEEWKRNGGGLKRSMAETRRQIKFDQKSKFSEYVRRAWSRQKTAARKYEMSKWPLTNEEYSVVTIAFSEANEGALPQGCSGGWMADFLWEELVALGETEPTVVKDDGLVVMIFSDAPSTFKWESPYASYWTHYWLLRRMEPDGE